MGGVGRLYLHGKFYFHRLSHFLLADVQQFLDTGRERDVGALQQVGECDHAAAPCPGAHAGQQAVALYVVGGEEQRGHRVVSGPLLHAAAQQVEVVPA